MQFLWKYIDDLVGKGLEGHLIAQLFFYAGATFVPLALPLAILLSSLMTFGNLGEHYELVAMKASGISISRIMKPLVLLSFTISVLAFIFSNNVLPVANLKFQSLLYDIRQQKLAFNIHEGVFYNGIENYIIRIGSKENDNKTIYDVRIYDHSARLGSVKVTTAKSGFMELSPDQTKMIFTLFDGYSYTDILTTRNYRQTRPFERTSFKQQRVKFDLTQFDLTRTQEELFKSHHTMLNIRQLNQFIDSLNLRYNERKKRFVENVYRRYQYLSTLDTLTQIESEQPVLKYVYKRRSPVFSDSISKFASKSDNQIQSNIDTASVAVVDTLHLPTKAKWSLLTGYTLPERFNIIELALNAARSNRDNIAFTKSDLDFQTENIRKHEIVWHKKFTLSIACLILFFIGAPMGAIIRKGGLGLPVVIAVFFFVIYHITSITGEKAAKVGDLDMVLGVWLSSIVLLPIGLFLTYKSTTDAPLLDAESWRKTLKKYAKFLKSN